MLLCTRCAASVSSGWNFPGVNVKGWALTAVQASKPSRPRATYDLRAQGAGPVTRGTRRELVRGKKAGEAAASAA